MVGKLRAVAALLGASLLTLAITLPATQSFGTATVVLLLVMTAATLATLPTAAAPIVRAAPGVQQARSRTPRLCCPVLSPRDPACPRAPGIG